jgi:hypothetical protein
MPPIASSIRWSDAASGAVFGEVLTIRPRHRQRER